MIETGAKKASPFACLVSQLYVFYKAAEKRAFLNTVQRERITIPAFSVFFGQGHVQKFGTISEGSFRWRYYAFFILSNESFKDAISFAYVASFSIPLSAAYSTTNVDDYVIAPIGNNL